jgi:type IV pilus assembly protein PilZ
MEGGQMSDSVTVSPQYAVTREHQRFEVSMPVDCSTQHVFVSNHVCNISKGGIFIRSDAPLPLNSEVSLVLRLPGTDRCIRATGRVVWNFDMQKGTTRIVPGSGIRFVGMPPEDRAALEGYLAELSRPKEEMH